MTDTLVSPGAHGVAMPVPATSFAGVAELCRHAFGFTFLTVLENHPARQEIRRVFSSHPQDYPTGRFKPMGGTPWGAVVLEAGQSWLGEGEEAIRWAFPDADLILGLGCYCCACAPVLDRGRVIGVLSLNGPAGAYRPGDLGPLGLLAGLLTEPLGQVSAR
ncbi:MAG: hypothetical protein Q4G25_07540 [Paracoccus sp. (in: a-proteobacteria)]|nr:hypothetical protein [Paracoccus sp. (in: a-proteobacteria)]